MFHLLNLAMLLPPFLLANRQQYLQLNLLAIRAVCPPINPHLYLVSVRPVILRPNHLNILVVFHLPVQVASLQILQVSNRLRIQLVNLLHSPPLYPVRNLL